MKYIGPNTPGVFVADFEREKFVDYRYAIHSNHKIILENLEHHQIFNARL